MCETIPCTRTDPVQTDAPGCILHETCEQIKQIIGEKISEITIKRVVIGIFYTGVELSTGYGGICFTPVKEIPESVCCPTSARAMPRAGRMRNTPVVDVFRYLDQKSPIKKAITIATINALSAGIWAEKCFDSYSVIEGDDFLSLLKTPEIRKAVVIGALIPILKTFREKEIPYRVAELDIRTLKGDEVTRYVSPQDLPAELRSSDIVVISGTTLINDTLEQILKDCPSHATVITIGPTATMLPDAFFKRGVTACLGNEVVQPDEILEVLSEGGSGYHFFGTSSRKVMIVRRDS